MALANIDLDTGDHVKRGEYPLADETYAQLLKRITSRPDRTIPIDLQRNLLRYYGASQTAPPIGPRVQAQLNVLKGMRTGDGLTAEPEPEPEVAPEN
jgi:CHASE2 domain-containing sensor protein